VKSHHAPVVAAAWETLEARRLLHAPALDAIPAYIVPVGKTVQIPVHATYDHADPLTFTVTDNSSQIVTQYRASTNTFIEMTVQGYSTPMVFQLFDDLAPQTVARIKGLVNAGFYDGLTFHRVVNNFVIQGGDPNGDGSGGPGFQFDDEFTAAATFTGDGQLAMANSGKDTNGSQFFVTEGPQRFLDFNHTIFGQLVSGKATRDAISDVAVDGSSRPNSVVRISRVRVIADTTDAVLQVKLSSISSGQVTVAVSSKSGTASRTFNVTGVADTVNDPPILGKLNPVYYTAANTPITIKLTSVDPEGSPVQFGGQYIDQNGASAALNPDTGVLTITPKTGYVGPVTLYVGVGVPGANSRGSAQSDNNQPLFGIYDTQQITIAVGDAAVTGSGNNIIGLSGAPANNVVVATFKDADKHAAASNYTAKINWGDGGVTSGSVVKNSNGTFSVLGSHAYAAAAADATYPIYVAITGNLGAGLQTSSAAVVQSFAFTKGGVLRVNGTSGADRIGISRKSTTYFVTVNGQTRSFPSSSVTSIQAYSFDSNDLIQMPDTGLIGAYLDGGAGNDVLVGSSGDDTINGADGRDTIRCNDGNDRVAGGTGNDTVSGGVGKDRLFGQDGNDSITGDGSPDIISGDAGDDILIGGSSNDTIYGMAGNDIINGLNGADSLDGGLGNDTTKLDNTDTRIAIEVLV
jgi:cyclophilin family peptidyl-prolyl cis-trans isomerase